MAAVRAAAVVAGCASDGPSDRRAALAAQPACSSRPDHHDGIRGVWLDDGLAPLFMKIRDEMPGTAYGEPLDRSAFCVATSGPARGTFHQGR